MSSTSLDNIVSLCKRRGFVFPGSEIYGGLANTWDYGPLGVELKNNIKRAWWKNFVHKRDDMVGLDAAILMNPKAWEASGHVSNFTDPLIDCKKCKNRFRADKLIEEHFLLTYPEIKNDVLDIKLAIAENNNFEGQEKIMGEKEKNKREKNREFIETFLKKYKLEDQFIIDAHKSDFLNEENVKLDTLISTGILNLFKIKCPNCKSLDWAIAKNFNLMFKTHQGVVEETAALVYLRPETAQGIFVNFKNVAQTTRRRLPFGVAQIGKAFRNEITPGNFTFRTREFEQMEIEYFFDPKHSKWEDVFEEWKKAGWSFLTDTLGIDPTHMRLRDHEKDELSHYSKGTTDVEYAFPWGWGELCAAAAYRTDYDLNQHEKFSGEDLHYTDPDEPTRKLIPHVMEPSFGADRVTLAVLLDAYREEKLEGDDVRIVMKFDKKIAPVKAAVLPLSKKEHLVAKAKEIHTMLIDKLDANIDFDVTGSIGKRYRRQDEIGTPTCVTVDFGTLGEDEAQGEKDTVTIRDRDTLKQIRVPVGKLIESMDL